MSYVIPGAPVPYNGTGGLGGDAATTNLNQWFQSGDQSFIIFSSALVWLMVPGLGFLYSGLARRKSALSMLWITMATMSVVVIQYYLFGYSLAFSEYTNDPFIGDWHKFALTNTMAKPSVGSPLVPDLLYAMFQSLFAAVTGAIISGAVAERGRMVPFLVFIFLWATFVYAPMTRWIWSPAGWAFKFGALDYAGGAPVELNSGAAALAYSIVLGKRQERLMISYRPHNVSFVILGTAMLWFGWVYGFNAGSSLGANLRAIVAAWNSTLTAVFSALAWSVMDYRLSGKYSAISLCSGFVAGLVAATPSSGFIPLWGAVITGILVGIIANLGTKVKYWLKVDDAMDIFTAHSVSGIVGLLANGAFASETITGLDGVSTGLPLGGWVDHVWKRMYIQVAYIAAGLAYSFVVSLLLAYLVNIIPGLHLRVSDEAELRGIDDAEIGEYSYDYVEVRRDYLAWTPARPAQADGEFDIPDKQRHGIPQHSKIFEGTADASMEDMSLEHGHIGGNRHAPAYEHKEQAKHN